MSAVRTKNTGPELAVRRLLHAAGFRYRLHDVDLPGKPDIVLPAKGKVIFVHGCFWHGHSCAFGRLPKSRLGYWRTKIATNGRRDIANLRRLRRRGWGTIVVWQCELRDLERLMRRLRAFIQRPMRCKSGGAREQSNSARCN
jgi:DNA mismatch endonuclease (patch repair protein)